MWIRKVIDCLILLHLLSWHWTDRSQGFLQIDDDWSSKEREERQRDSPYARNCTKPYGLYLADSDSWLINQILVSFLFPLRTQGLTTGLNDKWQTPPGEYQCPTGRTSHVSVVRENAGCRGTSATWKHGNLRSCIMNCSCMFILCPSL